MSNPFVWPAEQTTFRETELQNLTYTDLDGNEIPFPSTGCKPGVVQASDGTIVDQVAYDKDVAGFTNPNLHRRIDPQEPEQDENPLNQEVAPRDYKLEIHGVHSYRTTTYNVHDEDSITTEIP